MKPSQSVASSNPIATIMHFYVASLPSLKSLPPLLGKEGSAKLYVNDMLNFTPDFTIERGGMVCN